MQTLITIPLSQRFPNTLKARGYFARVMDGKLPSELFHHHPESGKSLQHRSPFRFSCTAKSLRITGIGHSAASLLFGVFPNILASFPNATMTTGSCALLRKPYLQNFTVKSLVLSNTHARGFAARSVFQEGTPLDSFTITAESLIRNGINSQLEILDQDLPEDFILGDVMLHDANTVLHHTKRHLTARAEFRSNYYFQGIWHVGKLTNLGFGRIVT